jgi:hypothetical protein
VAKVEEAIERFQEYRTALITAAATSKIDVREESTKDTKGTKDTKYTQEFGSTTIEHPKQTEQRIKVEP